MVRERGWRSWSVMLGVAVAMLAQPEPGTAQYFGRNFVQWDEFDWQVMHSPHYDIHFYPEERTPTVDASRMSERWYVRLSELLNYEFEKKPLIFYANHPDFQQTPLGGGQIGEGTGGFTESVRNRVVLPFTGVYADNDHVLGHEMVHVFQYSISSGPGGGGPGGLNRLPLWFIEGMAEYLSIGRVDANTAMWLRDAAVRGEFPTIDQLTRDPRFFPYRYGEALWAYIAGRWGDPMVNQLFRAAVRSGIDDAVLRVLGLTTEELSREWLTSVRAAYLPATAGRLPPAETGRGILADPDDEHMNVGPVVSPDGRYVAFFSSRGLFSIDLYLADARTGKVLRELASPRQTPHFDALSFIANAGAWSPDGNRFAFVTFARGNNEIEIVDVESGDVVERVAVEGVGAMRDPFFSPDGTRMVFSGDEGGLSDLYIYDFTTRRAEQLTDDRYAEIQPTWSPDGRSIVFATDRGPKTDFETLTYGPMQLAILDVESREIRMLPIFEGSKHINPYFSPDSRDIYFVSDVDGVSDIFRHTVATGETHRMTNVSTGVSGIAALSPAISVAQRTGEVVYSAFQEGRYLILALQEGPGVAVTPAGESAEPPVLAVLPPYEALGQGEVSEYLASALTGLPTDTAYETTDYKPSLGLEYLGTPTAGVSVSRFGAGFAGGVAAYFTDMLATRSVSAVIQANGSEKDIGGQAFYQKTTGRWHWGVGGGHIPYLTGFANVFFDPASQETIVEQDFFRIFYDQVSGVVQYPFSTTRRFETNTAVTRISFDREIRRFRIIGNQVEDEEVIELDAPDAMIQAQIGAAYVGDNSVFGFTSPIMGGRFRYEVEPTIGTLQYQTLLADHRRYFFTSPVTFAVRGLHLGRYGRDADSTRFLTPLFIGHESLVRGYAFESFDAELECSDAPAQGGGLENVTSCPEINRLIGSRIALANAEVRVPLFGVPGLGLINFPYLPTELAAFVDAGVAWTSNDGPDFRFERETADRVPVVSTGVSARVNVLGYLVVEAYYAYPFQRPQSGWHWGFNIAPGW